MMLNFKPTKDRVLIEPLYSGNESVGSIAIPEQYRDRTPTEGMVAAVGPKVTEVKVGQRVIFPRYDGQQIEIQNKIFKLFAQKEILAYIE